jgi:eukaryotic-like serine/threonine-protein kinase
MAQRFGKYLPIRELGKGASGTVHLALDTYLEQYVALKLLDPELVKVPELGETYTKLFMNEASLAGRLSHPHIAAIFEAAVIEGFGYVALEYVPGGDLSQFTSPETLLSVQHAIEIAFKACGALDYAYKQGIVHRDIKPSNIMVADGTNIKIVDFGAAYFHAAKQTEIARVGTPLYMSPEQISGEPLGHHCDMFSLGVVLYELFTGRRPFEGTSLTEIFDRILHSDPIAPSLLRKDLPEDVDRIVLRMLRKAPEMRYATWAELAVDIAEVGDLGRLQSTIPDSEKFTGLRGITLLEPLSDGEIWELVYAAHWIRTPSQKVILREGDFGDSVFLLASGEVKVTKNERLLDLLSTGVYFGEMAYVKGGAIPRQATVTSTTDALIAEFPSAVLQQVSTNCQLRIALSMLHSLVDRLALADERIARKPKIAAQTTAEHWFADTGY